jgi:hypothetical protein
MKFQKTFLFALASIPQIAYSQGGPANTDWDWGFAPSCAVSPYYHIGRPSGNPELQSNTPAAFMPLIGLPHNHIHSLGRPLRHPNFSLKLHLNSLHPDHNCLRLLLTLQYSIFPLLHLLKLFLCLLIVHLALSHFSGVSLLTMGPPQHL